MSFYHTEQKKLLLDYLDAHKDNSLTIAEITEGLKSEYPSADASPGKSTVYRLINKLHEEGKVRRFTKSGTRQSAYQLVEDAHCVSHLHMKCTSCGKLLHVRSDLSDLLTAHIRANHRFTVDENETVLYGICFSCNKAKG